MEKVTADVLSSATRKCEEQVQGRLRQADKIDVKLPAGLGKVEPYF